MITGYLPFRLTQTQPQRPKAHTFHSAPCSSNTGIRASTETPIINLHQEISLNLQYLLATEPLTGRCWSPEFSNSPRALYYVRYVWRAVDGNVQDVPVGSQAAGPSPRATKRVVRESSPTVPLGVFSTPIMNFSHISCN